jgi:DNA-binding transcriptional MerR regulator
VTDVNVRAMDDSALEAVVELHDAEGFSTIGDMARMFGVSLRALRFYEDRGLLRPVRRGTARLYDARARHNLRSILQGKQLGFTLSEIQEILSAPTVGTDAAAELELSLPPEQIEAQLQHLERQRADLDQAILALRRAHRRLAAS